MENSRLNSLPGELRNRIYRFALVQSNAIDLCGAGPQMILDTGSRPGVQDALALLSTCKQVRAEALSMFFAENIFHIEFSDRDLLWAGDKYTLRKLTATRMVVGGWLRSLGSSARYIQHVKFEIGIWTTDNDEDLANHQIKVLVRTVKGLCALFDDLPAVPEMQLVCQWAENMESLPGDTFILPQLDLTFRDGKTLRRAIVEAFKDEETLVESALPEPDEPSYGYILEADRRAELWLTRKYLETAAAMLEREDGH